MELKTFAISSNAQLHQKIGNYVTPIQCGQLAVVLYINGVVVFDIAGSSFQLLTGTQIQYESAKDFKRIYHFVSDPLSGTVLILKVNENSDNIDKIFKEGVKLIPLGSSSFLLNSSNFKSITKSDPSKIPSIKFTQSKTIGGTINPNSYKIQPSITPSNQSENTQPKLVKQNNANQNIQNALGYVPKGAQILGQGVVSVGKTVGQTTGNLVGGIVGGLTNIGQGLYHGVKNGISGK